MCSCVEFIAKYVLFITNLVFSLIGLALVGIGIAVLLQISEITDLIPVPIEAIPIALIVLGSTIFIIAFLGCCGAIKESCCMLSMFSILMTILAAAKIYLSVVVYQNLDSLGRLVNEWLTTAFNANNREPFYVMQIALRCCGTTGALSYGLNPLPPSCCAQDTCTVLNAYGGCVTSLTDYLDTFGNVIGAMLLIVIIVELVSILFALILTCTSNNNERRRRY